MARSSSRGISRQRIQPKLSYETKFGRCYTSSIEDFLTSRIAARLTGKINLIFTSPPFPLASPKEYGNLVGEQYLQSIVSVVSSLIPLLADDGSLVMEIGNAWDKGSPTMSTLPLRTLLAIEEQTSLVLCQQFVWENTAKLPGPATWVNKERIRLKDSHTHLWWFSPTPRPKADNQRVLVEYSPAMKRLIATGKYNHGTRPSEHVIGKTSFKTDNNGAIHGSTIAMGNTYSDPGYSDWCRSNGVKMHPARMPINLAEFFIMFLTEPGDRVLDPFGGSNTTGRAAENLKRRWITTEMNPDYVIGSHGRFQTS